MRKMSTKICKKKIAINYSTSLFLWYLELGKTKSIPRIVMEKGILLCDLFIPLRIRLLVGDGLFKHFRGYCLFISKA